MATGQRAKGSSRGRVASKLAKLAKPKKTAPAAIAHRRPAAKRAAGSKAKATRKRKGVTARAGAVIPYLTVRDVIASRAFYEKAFGFKHGETLFLSDGSPIQTVMHHAGAVTLKISPEGVWSGSMQAPVTSGAQNPIVLYVPWRKVDDLTARARAAGATIVTEPEDMFWGERIARIADPDGYVWCFAAKVGQFDPHKIPQVAEDNRPPQSELQQNPVADLEPQQAQKSDLDFEF